MKLTVRPIEKEDFDFCKRIERENMDMYPVWVRVSPEYREISKWWIIVCSSKTDSFILLDNKKRIGFLLLTYLQEDDIVLSISNIQIEGNKKSKGIGEAILSWVEQYAISKNIHMLKLAVFEENPARFLYEKVGFEYTGEKNHEGSLIMYKELDSR